MLIKRFAALLSRWRIFMNDTLFDLVKVLACCVAATAIWLYINSK